MNPLLQDLYSHQFWADAEHWSAIGSHAPARDDEILHRRLHHLHFVQRVFMWAVGDRSTELVRSKPEDFPTFESLRAFARESHAIIDRFLSQVTDEQLTRNVTFPWWDPPLTIRADEALTQCVMHGQWHRGQNAARLRELGGEPPTVDLIIWYWKGRPAPKWNA